MGSLQSAILGFGVFRVLHCFDCMKGFTVEENVIVQTTSVATATMPLAAGESSCIRLPPGKLSIVPMHPCLLGPVL